MAGNYYIPNGGWVMILAAYPVAGLGFLLLFLSWAPAAAAGQTEDAVVQAGGVAGVGLMAVAGLALLHLAPILLIAGIIRVAVEPIMRQNEVLITLQTSAQRAARIQNTVRVPQYQAPEPPPMVKVK